MQKFLSWKLVNYLILCSVYRRVFLHVFFPLRSGLGQRTKLARNGVLWVLSTWHFFNYVSTICQQIEVKYLKANRLEAWLISRLASRWKTQFLICHLPRPRPTDLVIFRSEIFQCPLHPKKHLCGSCSLSVSIKNPFKYYLVRFLLPHTSRRFASVWHLAKWRDFQKFER